MGDYESEDLTGCADCGMIIASGEERTYAFGTDGVLCMSCAVRRGGAYDEARDRWVLAPRVDDLYGRHAASELA